MRAQNYWSVTIKVWNYIKKKLYPFKYYILVIDILLILALPFAIVHEQREYVAKLRK